jgi:Rrf2 family protein
MKFSTKAEYGLRAIVDLAKYQGQEPYSLAKIAQNQKISLAYLERLFAKLKKADLVKSEKGVHGGYRLAKPALAISIREIFLALEGTLAPYSCLATKSFCTTAACPTKIVWQKLDQEIGKTLEAIKLADLIK